MRFFLHNFLAYDGKVKFVAYRSFDFDHLAVNFASGNASFFSLTMSFNLESIINIGISRLLHFLGS